MKGKKIYAFADEASPVIDQQIEAMTRNNLDGLEIRNVDGINISEITIEKAKEVKAKMDAYGFQIWSIGSPIGKIGIDEDFTKHLESFKHTLELAAHLNVKNIRLFSFYLPAHQKPELYKNEVIHRLGQFLDTAKGYRLNLCHENEKGIYGDKAERCLELHQTFSELKAVFDPANFVQCKVDTLKAWGMLKDYVHYMHIKDADKNGIVVPAGFGVGNVKEIASAYMRKGGNSFTIEPHLTDFYGFANLEQKHKKEGELVDKKLSDQEAFDIACHAFQSLW